MVLKGMITAQVNPLDQVFKTPGYLFKATEARFQMRFGTKDEHKKWEELLVEEYLLHRNQALNKLTKHHKEQLDVIRKNNRQKEDSVSCSCFCVQMCVFIST